MAKEPRPKGYPKLKNYKPSQFMLPTSHYDKKKADRAVTFIENLCHTKGKWAGTPFWLLPWQEQLIRDIFGIVKPDGNRQFRTAFVEICKKVGKSELAAAVALYLLYADNEPSAEVYGAAADRQQASIVFDVAKQMVEMSPALMKRSKLMGATKRIVNYSNAGYYQVLSAEVGGKHGFSVSGLVFDEIHTQPNRQLYDVLTKGSSDARQNPLHFIITTAGNDRHSIAYELHTKAVDILEGRRVDPTFYPVVYGLKDDEDWEDEENWYKVNPSLTQKTIALSVKTARVTADVLKNMLRKYLSGQKQKGKNSYKVGKQSYKELKSQGSGLSNIEITDGNIKSFERVAKKYRLDFALKKDSSTKPPTYYVFFKGQDTEMMNLAFKKYLGVQMNKKDKPSIMKKLMHFKDAVSKGKNRERAREQQKDRGQSL